jgi:glycosyltransferase involved in cell wall biosynthesis
MSSQVVAGSSYLKSLALKYNSNVTMIPTVVDTDGWAPSKQSGGKRLPTIVWTGNPSSSYYLETAADMLSRLARAHQFRLLIIGASNATASVFQALPNTEFRPWSLETELPNLLEADIGIMPIVDDIWAKGKCGLKAIQYMALGLPAVCSPYGANSDIITHQHDGFLASTDSEWESTLANLLEDSQLRHRIGAAARTTVVARFSLEANAPKLLSVLRQAAHGS